MSPKRGWFCHQCVAVLKRHIIALHLSWPTWDERRQRGGKTRDVTVTAEFDGPSGLMPPHAWCFMGLEDGVKTHFSCKSNSAQKLQEKEQSHLESLWSKNCFNINFQKCQWDHRKWLLLTNFSDIGMLSDNMLSTVKCEMWHHHTQAKSLHLSMKALHLGSSSATTSETIAIDWRHLDTTSWRLRWPSRMVPACWTSPRVTTA